MLFKIWNVTREQKFFVSIDENDDTLYENLLLKVSTKMELNGSSLVLESDGTVLDDNETLKMLHRETLMILQPGERWHSPSFSSLSDTISVVSSHSNASISSYNEQLTSSHALQNSPESRSILVTDVRTCENTWLNFEIPWEKMNASTIKDCEEGNRSSRVINYVVQVVADAMRDIKHVDIPHKAIRLISSKIVSKYPLVFEVKDDDGVVMGDGSIILFNKLKDRIKYLNRPEVKKRSNKETSDIVPLNKKKKLLARKAGCSNWQPSTSTNSDSPSNQEFKEKLKYVNFDLLDDETIEMLESTYPLQRTFLNAIEAPTVLEIKKEWPILLSEKGICWHYNKLMDQDISILSETMLMKSNKFINFGCSQNILTVAPQADDEKLVAILKVISGFFRENLDALYCQGNEKDNIVINNMISPGIIWFEREHSHRFTVNFENEIIHEGDSLRAAIECMFALYYILNLEYPKEASNTMEVMQRYFLKIHPDQGSKNKKLSAKAKIIKFLNKLRDF